METNHPDFGSWVKAARKNLGWTQNQLANKSFCSIDAIRAIEQNRPGYRPSEEVITHLAKVLEIPADQFQQFLALGRQKNPIKSAEATSTAGYPVAENIPAPLAELYVPAVASNSHSAPQHLARNQWMKWSIGFLLLALLGVTYTIVKIGNTRLVGQDGLVMLETATHQTINTGANGEGGEVQAGELVTVTFVIQNIDTHPIWIPSLSLGARGPGAREKVWEAPEIPFSAMTFIWLWPGQTITYQHSGRFYIEGDYFVEPVMQNGTGAWGGIGPFTRVYFRVTRK